LVPTVIFGAHVVIYSRDASADRAFFRDVLGYSSVDAGHEWLIFELPPAELAVHPVDEGDGHELYLMCDDLRSEMDALAEKNIQCSDLEEARWGSVTEIPHNSLIRPAIPRTPGGGRNAMQGPIGDRRLAGRTAELVRRSLAFQPWHGIRQSYS
jgi:catechol 2,3-dioxygenase-like lactoylglutathione lyase family enzyme